MNCKSTVVTMLALSAILSQASGQPVQKPKWKPGPHIAATEPLRPEQQLKKLKAPPGFEIQLVAADPDIRKPINIAFDAAGRLWVTETIEYPFAAKEGQGRDAVKILEDFGPDGRARKITTFADKLNIPIGVIPDVDGKGALVYSIPSIAHMTDTKGAGKADRREVYYGNFGVDDTHGMTGEFLRGFDGWIYACHGFRNTSNVKSKDGSTAITMTSGNTYRIKPDGSRIERYTYGQVNPFGIAIDSFGNLYTGDCHSKPLTMLLRGALYEHFGNKHDGLGFAPHMNTFKNHSTALCGITYYTANQFPKAFHGKLFLGDVVLNRVNAYDLKWSGTSPAAVMEDFITSQDPWFRPVDIKLGPDGCLYIADFYNRVIGHYELPLTHPARDREKGRIWRVVYRGPDGTAGPLPVINLVKADVKALVQAIANPNITVRLQAADQLVERGGGEAIAALQPFMKDVHEAGSAVPKAHALWVLERLGKLDDDTLARASSAKEKEVRVHAMRIVTEKKEWTPKYAALAKLGLLDADPLVQRVAVEALAAHPAVDQVEPLLILRRKQSPADTHLVHATRLALREHLRAKGVGENVARLELRGDDQRNLADVCSAVPTEGAAEFLKIYFAGTAMNPVNLDQVLLYARHIVRYGGAGSLTWVLDHVREKYKDNAGVQGNVLKAALQATQERGAQPTASDRAAAEGIVGRLLKSPTPGDLQVGAELAGTLKLVNTQPQLLAMARQTSVPDAVRKACVAALISLDAKSAIPPLAQVLLNDKEAIAVREQIASALAGTKSAEAHAALVRVLQNAPARLQTTIALGMASSASGGDKLLQAIEQGKASRRLLLNQTVAVRLQSAKIANLNERVNKLTSGLPPANQQAQALIASRHVGFATAKTDIEMGHKIFQKQCAACHQVSGQGAKVGPQLDGVGIRGIERLLEDVLDPNRNVDQAFRTTLITTKAGQSVTGLFLRDEGEVVILADTQGKEVRIEKKSIDERALSPLSPMPGNIAELISEAEFHHLMAYLLDQRSKK